MKKLLIILFTGLFVVAAAQGDIVYSSNAKAQPQSMNDSLLINHYNQQSSEYFALGRMDEALQYAQRALSLSQQCNDQRGEATAWMHIGRVYIQRGNYHKGLTHLYRSLKICELMHDKTKLAKLYKETAIVFTSLKLYPQAFKCYYKMLSYANRSNNARLQAEVATRNKTAIGFTQGDSLAKFFTICSKDTALANENISIRNSPPIKDTDLTAPFYDSKSAVAYGIMIHVQQPVRGKRLKFTKINEVGHTFITLVKFNADSSSVSRSFGFYPKKDNFLAATPLHPLSASIFKNDTYHDWDEVVGKFISRKQFERILEVVRAFKNRKYNLSTNNCTDFGLNLATIAGIDVKGTAGRWPLGKGNNPGDMGQSILEGKVLNADANDPASLFIYSRPVEK